MQYWCTSFMVALMLTAWTVRAESDITINTFNSADEVANWVKWWGSCPVTLEFDQTKDASGNTNTSGALKVTVNFDKVAYGGDNQFAIRGGLSGTNPNPQLVVIDGTKYTNFVFNMWWDTNSPTRPWGDLGGLEPGLVPSDYTQIMWPGIGVVVTNGWQTIRLNVDTTAPKMNIIGAVILKMWSGDAGWGQTGTATFWIDNVKLIASVGPPPPPPTMAIGPAKAGLQLTSVTSGQYDRQSIYALNPSYSWVGASTSVTYSVTIKEFPDASHAAYQTHILLAPSSGLPYGAGDSAADWNSTNLVFVHIENLTNGAAFSRFMFKTNVSNPNDRWDGQIFGSNTIASLGNPSPIGTWSVTFNNNTNVQLKGPDGATTNFVMSPDATALFADPLYAWFGVQNNRTNNVGQSALFSKIQITGVASEINETFPLPALDNTTWGIAAAGGASAIQVATVDTPYLVSWSLPDTGFTLQTSPLLKPTTWTDAGLTVSQSGGRKKALIPTSISTTNSAYFRLEKRVFTKLQVLLPGETAAPGTVSGKTGTPTAQQANAGFDITVNAVDATWNPVSSTDTVHLTASGGSPILPTDTALVNGTATLNVIFTANGNFTITASDVTDPTKTSNTSSSVTVNP